MKHSKRYFSYRANAYCPCCGEFTREVELHMSYEPADLVAPEVIDNQHCEFCKSTENRCDECGDLTTFTLNCCEECFDKLVDEHYDGGIDEE